MGLYMRNLLVQAWGLPIVNISVLAWSILVNYLNKCWMCTVFTSCNGRVGVLQKDLVDRCFWDIYEAGSESQV